MKLQIKNRTIPCEVKNSAQGIQQGMMGRGRLDGCMLFILPSRGDQSFWMKDCLIPLDIVFCDNNKVTAINKNCEPCDEEECGSYSGFGNIALEFKGGFCDEIGLKVGDEVRFVP
jgi:uncharacterized membrane protein (UPF0127 family)